MFDFLNKLAHEKGMPETYRVFQIELVGKPPNERVKMTGDAPIGVREDGRPLWPKKRADKPPMSVIVTWEAYREASDKARSGDAEP